MKNMLILWVLLFGFQSLQAQETSLPVGTHQHDGFYLSLGAGPVMGPVTANGMNANATIRSTVRMSGPGGMFDFKIGGEVRKNLLLHATILSNALAGPSVKSTLVDFNSTTEKAPNTFIVGEEMAGVGITSYVMPANILVSGSIGFGRFSYTDQENSASDYKTKPGVSFQLKVGKEWWVSRNWGLGLGVTYGRTTSNLKNDLGEVVKKYDSRRFGVLFNATFN
ncbi:MAG TPA: hypothetical protein VGK10_07550 [Prolixibacteraceae bacterium]|jgi:hypothetical protein